MTVTSLISKFATKSGKPLQVGTGSGTKWQWAKKANPEVDIHQELVDQLVLAINTGFTHIDLAEVYTTGPEVGAALKQSGVKREDMWITSKYTPGLGTVQEALSTGPLTSLDKLLKELNTDYLDLFLVHCPFVDPKYSKGQTRATIWAEMIEAKKLGKVRYIGVSNYAIPHLEECFEIANGDVEYYPSFNQIEFHPYLQNQTNDIVKFCQDHDILVEAFGPLTPLFRIKEGDKEITDHPLTKLLPELSEKYGKTQAQILLRYTLQKDILPITTSSKEERIRESLEIYNFKLDNKDVQLIDTVGATYKFRGFFEGMYDEALV